MIAAPTIVCQFEWTFSGNILGIPLLVSVVQFVLHDFHHLKSGVLLVWLLNASNAVSYLALLIG